MRTNDCRQPLLALALLLWPWSVRAQDTTEEVPSPPHESFDLSAAIAQGPALSAERAAELAVQEAPSLDRARLLSQAAEASVARARAAMLPRLEFTAAYQHMDGFTDGEISLAGDPAALDAARALASTITDPAARTLWLGSIDSQANGTATIVVPRDRIAFSARLTWPVSDLFFSVLPAIDAAEAGVQAREHERAVAERGVRRSAREAYFTLAQARGALAVTEEAQRQTQAQLAQVEAAVHAGYLTEADRLAAEARVAEIAGALSSAQAGVEIADAVLRTLLGRPAGEPFGVTLEPVPVRDADLTAAVDTRPEIAALRAAIDAQRSVARVEEARGYPHLALFAGADYANPNRYQIPPEPVFTPSWELGAVLSWAPNDTLSAVHRVDQLSAERAAMEAQLEQLERMVRVEVAQANARSRAARRNIEAAHVAEAAATAAYESRMAQVRAGGATIADLFAAEGQLNRARLATLDAEVALRLAATLQAYAAGEL